MIGDEVMDLREDRTPHIVREFDSNTWRDAVDDSGETRRFETFSLAASWAAKNLRSKMKQGLVRICIDLED